MSRKYLVDEDTLVKLIKYRQILLALDFGGVNNWHYCSDSLNKYLKINNCEDFNELAKNIVEKDYEVYNEE